MAIHLLCLANGGLPIFTRKRGDCENLPFSTVASLNGFHIFFKSLGIQLQSIDAENDWSYMWKDFHNSVTVIACGRGLGEILLKHLIEVTFAAITLFVSRDELLELDRIKKESKNFLPIVDAALEYFLTLRPLLTDCILANENLQMQKTLQEFSNVSLFCSLVIDQRLAVATEGWWDLDIVDREVLLLLLNSSNTLQNDIPIYLPNKSPNVAYRFVTIPLAPKTVLCVICGSGSGPYNELNRTAQNIFRNDALAIIQHVERCIVRSLSEQLEVDANILAMILANFDVKKCVFSQNVQPTVSSLSSGGTQRSEMLKKFYYHCLEVANFFETESMNGKETELKEQYWTDDYHKCYALSDGQKNIIFVLFMASVPNHTMRFITQKLLNTILQEKNFCW